jgi:sec-independent protein translocase protein TatA
MWMPGGMELLVILIIVLIIFGAGKLPEIGEGLGRGIREFKKAVRENPEIDITPKDASKGNKISDKTSESSEKKD